MSTIVEPLHSRWVVGLDLRPDSHGAINFTRWLRERGRALTFDGLHIVDSKALELPAAPSRAELMGVAKAAAKAGVDARSASAAFDAISVVESADVEDALTAAGRLEVSAGLILGRRAAGVDQGFIRLGKVARRLLRRLPCPVFVVPADLEHAQIGRGPIVCAVEPDVLGESLVRHALQLGATLERPVHLVHVVGSTAPVGLAYVPETAWDEAHTSDSERAATRFSAWREAASFDLPSTSPRGRVVPALIKAARGLDACMILSSSRQLSLGERLFMSSVGSNLAASSHLPVGVIPPSG